MIVYYWLSEARLYPFWFVLSHWNNSALGSHFSAFKATGLSQVSCRTEELVCSGCVYWLRFVYLDLCFPLAVIADRILMDEHALGDIVSRQHLRFQYVAKVCLVSDNDDPWPQTVLSVTTIHVHVSLHACWAVCVSAIHVFRSRAGPGGVHDRSVPDQHGGTIAIGSAMSYFSSSCHWLCFLHVWLIKSLTDLLRHCRAAVMFSLCTVQELQVVTVVHQKVFGTSQDWAIDNNALHDFTSMVLILSTFDMR